MVVIWMHNWLFEEQIVDHFRPSPTQKPDDTSVLHVVIQHCSIENLRLIIMLFIITMMMIWGPDRMMMTIWGPDRVMMMIMTIWGRDRVMMMTVWGPDGVMMMTVWGPDRVMMMTIWGPDRVIISCGASRSQPTPLQSPAMNISRVQLLMQNPACISLFSTAVFLFAVFCISCLQQHICYRICYNYSGFKARPWISLECNFYFSFLVEVFTA